MAKDKHPAIDGEDYRKGALDRLEDARLLLTAEQFAGSASSAGRAVEGILRAVIWHRDEDIRRGKKSLDTGHDFRKLLTKYLKLNKPVFEFEKIGSKLVGSIVSDTFRGKSDRIRQKMIWDALVAELGAASVIEVGMLLAYTPEEWNIDLPVSADL